MNDNPINNRDLLFLDKFEIISKLGKKGQLLIKDRESGILILVKEVTILSS